MTCLNPSTAPPSASDADVAIVGAGLSGTLAAILLGRAGYRVTLVDKNLVYPAEFRVEKIAGDQVVKMQRLGLLPCLSAATTQFDEVVNARKGRIIDRTRSTHFGVFYQDLVMAMREQLPTTVSFVAGRVDEIRTSVERQHVSIANRGDLDARLIVLATGMADVLRYKLGIQRHVIHEKQSLTLGFNIRPTGSKPFKHPALTYYGEQVSDGIDYLNLFPAGGVTRANLFTFRDHRDPWIRAFRQRPKETLIATLPGLTKVLDDFEVMDRVQNWVMDLAVAQNCTHDGIVLIGDAYQTSCPAAGTGVSRLLTDVATLCQIHVPAWLQTPGMSAAKIATFYDDPDKRAMDSLALNMAAYRRNITIETGLRWRARRQTNFARRRVMNSIDRLSPPLATMLRRLRNRAA